MKVTVCGLWHLGCVYAAGSAEAGHKVTGWDHDPKVVESLNAGIPPLHEPGLETLIASCLGNGTLTFVRDLSRSLVGSELIWITYDTPVDESDRADCDFVFDKLKDILPLADRNAIVLVSSQLPVGSIGRLERMALDGGRADLEFAYSPENLRLGQGLRIFSCPDRVVCGVHSRRAEDALRRLWSPVTDRLEFMKIESAEMTKHAINSFLAVSVAYANEIAVICEHVGADAKEVERGLKSDARIGSKAYVGPGMAFAGGTLARDLSFLSEVSREKQIGAVMFDAARASNDRHKMWVMEKLRSLLSPLDGKSVAIWGLTYKPGTSTLRRSAALELAGALLDVGAIIYAHDPMISTLPEDLIGGRMTISHSALEAANGCDVVVLCTAWEEYKNIKAEKILSTMRNPIVIDPSGFLRESLGLAADIKYVSIGYIHNG